MPNIYVEYPNDKINWDMEQVIDDRLEEWGVKRVGSGCCMFKGGTRDIQYHAKTMATANAAARSIRASLAASGVKGFTVGVD